MSCLSRADVRGKVKLTDYYSAEFPDDTVHSLSTNEHLNVENDGKVTTQ